MKIALDAMGGDSAPASTVAGALEALNKYPDIELILVGDQARIEKELVHLGVSPEPRRFSIHHASQVVDMGDSAIDAVRRKKDSSISRAVDLLADGGADALVSAGHTGAFVAAAKVKLRTLPGIDQVDSAAGSTEALVCIEALRRELLPPTINYEVPDPDCDLDYLVDGARPAPGIRLALSNSFGFGGHNAVLCLEAA